ncbi:UDP-N-acetylglucosamine transporter TMEM241 isoform X5 [Oryctolagus cuniculus]|uniref:UDP-N-acetylglucosamine transporter TMEM241 isoform X5 n=1 Tax=Oryctolagus cuniculus TaxID=9986 RepID=UPI00387A0F3E
MCLGRSLVGFTYCTCYLASYVTNKYVLSVLKFTYPTLFQGWQTFVGGLLLHVSWKLGWVEINSSSRPLLCFSFCIMQLQRSSGAARRVSGKSALFLLAAAGCLPFNDAQFDPDGYFWAVIHLLCVGAYQMVRQTRKSSALSDIDQQYLNYIFSVVLLAFASPPTGDLSSVLDFPYLYFYQFHGSCCASGVLGFFLMLSTVKLRSLLAPGQCAAWIFFAKVVTAALSLLLFDMKLTRATVGCLLLAALGEALLVFSERKGS